MLLRCFLDITDQRMHLWQRTVAKDRQVALGFLAALRSPAFFEASTQTRYVHSTIWLHAGWVLGLFNDAQLTALRPPSGAAAAADDDYVDVFPTFALNAEMVTLWRGWKLVNGSGYTMWPDFSRVFRKFGPTWTADFHGAIASWFRARKQTSIPVLNAFLDFIVSTESVTAESLRNRAYVTQMWRDFWRKYNADKTEDVSQFVHLVNWKTWREFAGSALISPTLLARPLIEMPGPDSVQRPYFGETESGEPDSLGLIGLATLGGLSDSEAMDYFLREIPRAISAVDKWADHQTARVFNNYLNAKRAGRDGQARAIGETGVNTGERWLTDPSNPGAMSNAAATFKKIGYTTRDESDVANLFPQSLKETARYLGLPLRETILPFAATIVAEHPNVTPSFLEKLEFVDKNSKPSGFRKIDGGWYLIGVKDRKGTEFAEQRIQLSRRALRAVVRLIAITRAPRAYLRARNDDNWRRLFISTGFAFGYPRPCKFNSVIHHSKVSGELSDSLRSANLSDDEIERLTKYFSLRQLRKTVGIKVLLDTHSERAVAEALGHQEWRPALIKRYLPDSILRLFRARWIRMFQNLILIHTSPTVDYAIAVTGLANAEAIEKYLADSAFPHLKKMLYPEAEKGSTGSGEFIFEANFETVSTICTLAGVDQAKAPSLYWHLFAKHILAILKERASMDPELDSLLKRAA